MSEERAQNLTYRVPLPGGQQRLRELIIYICDRCETDDTFGATKLNKILFFSDFLSFQRYGQPITGETYQRLDAGPAPVALVPLRRDMIQQGDVIRRTRLYHGKEQHRLVPTREAKLDLFTGRDIALVDSIISQLWGRSATDASLASHGSYWRVSHDKEPIPYEFAYLSDEAITPGDIERTEELARELGWGQA